MAVSSPLTTAGGTGAATRVYVASDNEKTVVARCAPMVAGPAEHRRAGPIVVVEPQLVKRAEYPGLRPETLPALVLTNIPRSGAAVIAGAAVAVGAATAVAVDVVTTLWLGVPAAFAIGLAGCVVAWRRQLRVERAWAGHRVLTRHEDRQIVRAAVSAARRAMHAWPELQTVVALDDPAPTLADTLWQLTGALAEDAAIRDTLATLTRTAARLAPGSPAHLEVSARLERAREAHQRLDDIAQRRLTALTDLAEQTDAFIDQRRAEAAVRAVVRDADRALGSLGVPAPESPQEDPGTELAERTAAVLAAYRELTSGDPT